MIFQAEFETQTDMLRVTCRVLLSLARKSTCDVVLLLFFAPASRVTCQLHTRHSGEGLDIVRAGAGSVSFFDVEEEDSAAFGHLPAYMPESQLRNSPRQPASIRAAGPSVPPPRPAEVANTEDSARTRSELQNPNLHPLPPPFSPPSSNPPLSSPSSPPP